LSIRLETRIDLSLDHWLNQHGLHICVWFIALLSLFFWPLEYVLFGLFALFIDAFYLNLKKHSFVQLTWLAGGALLLIDSNGVVHPAQLGKQHYVGCRLSVVHVKCHLGGLYFCFYACDESNQRRLKQRLLAGNWRQHGELDAI